MFLSNYFAILCKALQKFAKIWQLATNWNIFPYFYKLVSWCSGLDSELSPWRPEFDPGRLRHNQAFLLFKNVRPIRSLIVRPIRARHALCCEWAHAHFSLSPGFHLVSLTRKFFTALSSWINCILLSIYCWICVYLLH